GGSECGVRGRRDTVADRGELDGGGNLGDQGCGPEGGERGLVCPVGVCVGERGQRLVVGCFVPCVPPLLGLPVRGGDGAAMLGDQGDPVAVGADGGDDGVGVERHWCSPCVVVLVQ